MDAHLPTLSARAALDRLLEHWEHDAERLHPSTAAGCDRATPGPRALPAPPLRRPRSLISRPGILGTADLESGPVERRDRAVTELPAQPDSAGSGRLPTLLVLAVTLRSTAGTGSTAQRGALPPARPARRPPELPREVTGPSAATSPSTGSSTTSSPRSPGHSLGRHVRVARAAPVLARPRPAPHPPRQPVRPSRRGPPPVR